MDDRPVCAECEHYRVRRARGTCGHEAVCTARTRNGRIIDWQYGMTLKFTRAELEDRIHSRISPRWCPKRSEK